ELAASADGARGATATSAARPRAPASDIALDIISSSERRLDNGKGALAADIVDRPHTQHRMQLLGRHLHGSRSGRASRSRLRECRRSRGMERDVALDLLLDLVDVAVEHGHRPEALQIAERAWGVLGSPTPFLVDRP